MKTISFTREELYDLVWKKTMEQITRLYGISSYNLRAACAEIQVPLPYASYWVQVRYGREWKTKLPQNYAGSQTVEILKKKFETEKHIPVPLPIVLLTREIEKDPKAPLEVGEKLNKPHRLIQITKDNWEKRDRSKSYWEPNREGLFLHVADALMPRAFRFMDALIKLLEYRGHELKKNQYGYTVAVVDGIEIEVHLREANKRVPSKQGYSATELMPTGVFVFQVGKYSDQKEWRDGTTPLEGILARIVAKLEIMAEKEKKWQEESRLRQIEREKQEAIERNKAERKQKEVQDFKALLEEAQRFDEVTKLRNYVKAVQEQTDPLDDQTQQWIIWAEKKINWMDPLIRAPDDIFTEHDLKQYKKW
ncbi:hypothetical protein OD917_16320 [Flavobacterium sp. SH_e]|uniref:hypothetical protein n=1 Tax=Flavobacterium sp. SH_e TaxID=2983767 RepID=UPI0021E3CFAB|nr:hypothetical protein [Flavobacterium sp. SH_e]MCV2486500.1 hypothetical protein [Flavobacterium sp. SH_e]